MIGCSTLLVVLAHAVQGVRGSAAEVFMGTRILYLVRHGQYVTDEALDEYGQLTALGRLQAQRTGRRLAQIEFSALYSSDISRAVETADIIAQSLGNIARHKVRALRELMPPAAKGSGSPPRTRQELAEVKAATSQLRRQFLRPLKGNRSRAELIVAHGNLIRFFVRLALAEPTTHWLHFASHNCGVTVLVVRDGSSNYLIGYNDVGHLAPKLQTVM
jgi:serine/threonine-protein phosphatase PGAM5